MDFVSRVFNRLSDPKHVPHVDRYGRHPDHGAVRARLSSPENAAGTVCAVLMAALGVSATPEGHSVIFACVLPFAILAFAHVRPSGVIRRLYGLPAEEAPVTIYKKPGVSSLEALEEATHANRHHDRFANTSRATSLMAAYGLLWLDTGNARQAAWLLAGAMFLISPVLAYTLVEETRDYLRNRMIIKGHWHAISGRKPPRIGPDKSEGGSFAVKDAMPSPA